MTTYFLPLLDMMGNQPNWLLNNMPEILMMVTKTKCARGLLSGGNGSGIPAGEAVFVDCLP